MGDMIRTTRQIPSGEDQVRYFNSFHGEFRSATQTSLRYPPAERDPSAMLRGFITESPPTSLGGEIFGSTQVPRSAGSLSIAERGVTPQLWSDLRSKYVDEKEHNMFFYFTFLSSLQNKKTYKLFLNEVKNIQKSFLKELKMMDPQLYQDLFLTSRDSEFNNPAYPALGGNHKISGSLGLVSKESDSFHSSDARIFSRFTAFYAPRSETHLQ